MKIKNSALDSLGFIFVIISAGTVLLGGCKPKNNSISESANTLSVENNAVDVTPTVIQTVAQTPTPIPVVNENMYWIYTGIKAREIAADTNNQIWIADSNYRTHYGKTELKGMINTTKQTNNIQEFQKGGDYSTRIYVTSTGTPIALGRPYGEDTMGNIGDPYLGKIGTNGINTWEKLCDTQLTSTTAAGSKFKHLYSFDITVFNDQLFRINSAHDIISKPMTSICGLEQWNQPASGTVKYNEIVSSTNALYAISTDFKPYKYDATGNKMVPQKFTSILSPSPDKELLVKDIAVQRTGKERIWILDNAGCVHMQIDLKTDYNGKNKDLPITIADNQVLFKPFETLGCDIKAERIAVLADGTPYIIDKDFNVFEGLPHWRYSPIYTSLVNNLDAEATSVNQCVTITHPYPTKIKNATLTNPWDMIDDEEWQAHLADCE